jgi:hypothetical protein
VDDSDGDGFIDYHAFARILAGIVRKPPLFLIAKSSIKTFADLRGANIGALSLTEGSSKLLIKMAKAEGIAATELKISAVGGAPVRQTLLKDGKIDAGMQPLPLNLEAEALGFNNLGWAGKYEPDWQFTTVNANGDWARKNPRIATGFVRALLREVGVIEGFGRDGRPLYDERHLCHAPQERLFIHGRWQEGVFPALGATAEDRAQLEAFRREMERYRRWRDGAGRRAFATPRAAGAPGAFQELDAISMAEFLTARGFTSPRLRWWVEYACRDDFGTDLAGTSAWAGVHYYAGRDPDPEAFEIIRKGAAYVVRVSEEEIAEAIRIYYTTTHNLAEGAGAAPLAALMKETDRYAGKRAGLILSGGNIDMAVFAQLLRGETPAA